MTLRSLSFTSVLSHSLNSRYVIPLLLHQILASLGLLTPVKRYMKFVCVFFQI